MNAVALKSGETMRQCLRNPGIEIRLNAEDGGPPEMATFCNQYEPSTRAYDDSLEEFSPLDPEVIEQLRAGPPLVRITKKKKAVKKTASKKTTSKK